MTERQKIMNYVHEAIASGASKGRACKEAGISLQTLRRWILNEADKRPSALSPEPHNKLSVKERDNIVTICNQSEFASLPPTQIVPILADKGEYIASESSFYRVLRERKQLHHRGRARVATRKKPTTHIAEGPNQVYSWDITYCPSNIRGLFYYLYMIVDIYSRKIVGYEVHEQESGECAAALVEKTVLREGCFMRPLVLHSDNGSPMKSSTLLAKLYELGISSSRGRPRVSNDNPYSESLFKTMKYGALWPENGFSDLDEARDWVQTFVDWYNSVHRHSGIKFVTPTERHMQQDHAILQQRKELYTKARAKNPGRWSGSIRNWKPVGEVALNPERVAEDIKKAA